MLYKENEVGRMNKYEARTQKKKDAIVAAALELFRKRGYTHASINDIAAASGVSTVSIYNYFGSKEGLMQECTRVLMLQANREAEELLQSNLCFKEKLLRVVALCDGQPQQLRETFSRDALDDKTLMDLYQSGMDSIKLDILRDFIESGKREGAIDSSLSTDIIMAYLAAIAAAQPTVQEGAKGDHAGLYRLMLYGLIGEQ